MKNASCLEKNGANNVVYYSEVILLNKWKIMVIDAAMVAVARLYGV